MRSCRTIEGNDEVSEDMHQEEAPCRLAGNDHFQKRQLGRGNKRRRMYGKAVIPSVWRWHTPLIRSGGTEPSSSQFRTHGNEHWEFDDDGLMSRRDMSANDIPIGESVITVTFLRQKKERTDAQNQRQSHYDRFADRRLGTRCRRVTLLVQHVSEASC